MNKYEKLCQSAFDTNVDIVNYPFSGTRIKGLYCDGNVAISNDIETDTERVCILAEELGHYATSSGNILDQSSTSNRKQELIARLWAYNNLIGLAGILDCYRAGCHTIYEMADHLEVTEEFLVDALACYKSKYGVCTQFDNYVIYFEPELSVLELI